MNKIPFFSILILFIFMGFAESESAITVNYRNLSSENAPNNYAEINAVQNGLNVELDASKIIIVEGAYTRYPHKVEAIGDGYFKVEWLTPYEVYPQYIGNAQTDDPHLVAFEIVVTNNNESGTAIVFYENPGLPMISVKVRRTGDVVKELEFYQTKRKQISVVSSKNHPMVNDDLYLDSITFTSPYFSYYWQGYEMDMNSRPPMKVIKGAHYLVDVFYDPPDDKAYRALMKFHYNNGMVKTISLVGGRFSIEQTSLLQLITPNGNELLTPCKETEIKWKGHSKDDPVIIEYSTNNGGSWSRIATVKDSVYNWLVPNTPGEDALVRVRQEFTNTQETILRDDWTTISKIAFSTNGTLALAANRHGKIAEFDIYNSPDAPINYYYVKPKNFTGNVINIAVDYIKNNTEIALFHRENLFSAPVISFFRIGEESAYNSIPTDMNLTKVHTDPQRRYFALQKRRSPNLTIISAENGSEIGEIRLNSPVLAASINRSGDSIAVIELDGKVSIFEMQTINNFNLIRNFQLTTIPRAVNAKFSPNGKLLAISVIRTDNTPTESFLYDLDREQIVRTYRPAVGSALEIDFSPSSGSLIIGSQNLDYIVMYDLTGSDSKSVLSGHNMQMTDMKLDPEGFAILSSSTGNENLKHRSFAYPEQDVSDNTFRIIEAKLDYEQIEFPDMIIGTTNSFVYTSHFCNNGIVPVIIHNVKFENGTHAQLLSSAVADTVEPGACKLISFEITPLDTGLLEDKLIISSCSIDFELPVNFRSLDRKLSLMHPNGIEMGEVCLFERVRGTMPVFRNDDSVAVLVNSLVIENAYLSPFRLESFIKDTLILPGQILEADFSFMPTALGKAEAMFFIGHSGQINVYKIGKLIGTGIGTFLESSHNRIMFVNELDSRTIEITNNGLQNILITSIALNPEGFYEVLDQLPITIPPGAKQNLTIRRINKTLSNVAMRISAEPCLVSGDMTIEIYQGSSLVEISNTTADPRGRADINIKYNNAENAPYNGKRFFYGEIIINPRMFLPDMITSVYGESEILSNEVIDGNRHISFKIEGDFNDLTGNLCTISGVAGLAETTSSKIEWGDAEFWGTSVETTLKNGMFDLTGVCEDRLILQNNTGSIIKNLFPNPADEKVLVLVESKVAETAIIEIVDYLGFVVFQTNPINLNIGTNEILLNLQYLSNGNYNILLRSDNNFFLRKLIILR